MDPLTLSQEFEWATHPSQTLFKLAVSPDGKYIGAAINNGALVLEKASGIRVHQVRTPQGGLAGPIAFNSDGTEVAYVTGKFSTVQIVSVKGWVPAETIPCPEVIGSIVFGEKPLSIILAIAGPHCLWVWDRNKHRMVQAGGPERFLSDMQVFNGNAIGLATPSYKVSVVDSHHATPLAESPDHVDAFCRLNDQEVLLCRRGGQLMVWNWKSDSIRKEWTTAAASFDAAACTQDGRYAFCSGSDEGITIWNTQSGQLVGRHDLGEDVAGKMVWCESRKELVLGLMGGPRTRGKIQVYACALGE
jgi:WD40 repeat protein